MEYKRFAFFHLLVLIFLALGISSQVNAQNVDVTIPAEGVVQELSLRDGSTVYGRVTDISDPMTFLLISGVELKVPHAQILKLVNVDGALNGQSFWLNDPNRTRLFFGPTGRTMPAGSGYFSVFELIMPFVSVAPTDWLILSGGTPLIFGTGSFVLYGGTKVRVVSTTKTDVAIGFLAVTNAGDDSGGVDGVMYGVVTHGTPDQAITLGVGYPLSGSELDKRPAVMLGGETRLSRKVKFLSENYLFRGGEGVLSLGFRFFGARLFADVGLAFPVGTGDFFGFPLVNFVYNWD